MIKEYSVNIETINVKFWHVLHVTDILSGYSNI